MKLLENFIFNNIINSTNIEHFNPKEDMKTIIQKLSNYQLIALIISVVISQLILLMIGKFLWNNYLVKLVTAVKPVTNIFDIMALSLLFKLIF